MAFCFLKKHFENLKGQEILVKNLCKGSEQCDSMSKIILKIDFSIGEIFVRLGERKKI